MRQQPRGASSELHRGQAHRTTAEGEAGIASLNIICYLFELDLGLYFAFICIL